MATTDETKSDSAYSAEIAVRSAELASLQREIARRVLPLIDGARRIPTMSASAISGLGAALIVVTFVYALAGPRSLCGAEYVTTMIVGTILVLVGPLVMARARVDDTKLAKTVLDNVEIDLGKLDQKPRLTRGPNS